MRLLLLLSALLSALTGVAGPRAVLAQPVAASAAVAGQVARAQERAVSVAAAFAPSPRLRDVERHGIAPAVLRLRPAVPLYADRLRE